MSCHHTWGPWRKSRKRRHKKEGGKDFDVQSRKCLDCFSRQWRTVEVGTGIVISGSQNA